jgi:hypothetical protein
MTTTELDTRTDYYAKSNEDMFPLDEKLAYYNEADGILNAMIIDEQENTNESETLNDTVAGQNAYEQHSRIHHVNWLKIDYGSGFIPARYKSEADLISEYGEGYEETLDNWDISDPIYYYKGSHLFVSPAPTADQAGEDRMWMSVELIPDELDRDENDTPTLVPPNFHYLHAAYAAMSWLDEDDPLWKKNERRWTSGIAVMLNTMFPRSRQEETQAHIDYDTGHNY